MKIEKRNLVYSPDDQEKFGRGWYCEKTTYFSGGSIRFYVSKQLYKTKELLKRALDRKSIRWERK